MFKEINKLKKLNKMMLSLNFTAVLIVSFFLQFDSVAQDVDPLILQQLQNSQSGKGSIYTNESLLDVARVESLSPEELKANEDAKIAVDLIVNNQSRLEKDYQGRIMNLSSEQRQDSNNYLNQFGYDLFSTIPISPLYNTGQFSDDYILGIGDQLIITLVGSENRSTIVPVDSEGRVVMSEMKPIQALGRKLGGLKREIKELVSSSMLGTDVFVSLGRVRRIGVYVLGEVSIPGLHALTSISNVLQALASSGGIKKTGSLRNIQIISKGTTKILDLYKMLEDGEGSNTPLEDGTRIIVPTIGETIAITGQVIRPGIYELENGKKEISGKSLLALSGGGLRSRGNDYIINHIEDDGRQKISSLKSLDDLIVGGDIVKVFYKKDLKVGEVTLSGHVRVPGPKSLDVAKSVSQLLDSSDVLGDKPYLPLAILETTDESSKARIYKALNLVKIMNGLEDMVLKDRDELFVLSAEEVLFISDFQIREIVVTGNVPKNSCLSLKYLARFVSSGDEGRFAAVTRSVFASNDDFENKRQNISNDDIIENQSPEVFADGTISPFSLNQGEQETNDGVLYCNEFFDKNVDLLPFVLENTVSTIGSVRRPGVYPVAGSASLSTMVATAGGFSNTADLENIEIIKPTNVGDRDVSSANLKINSIITPIETVEVLTGSSLRVNQLQSTQEQGTVLLSGEFVRPGVYSVSRGETLSQLFERAGGLTEFAYPFGAIMTKQSVKKEQEKGFRRVSREINAALAVAAIRSKVDAGALVAAQRLAKDLETVEAAGRVVIEADPAMLRIKSELDSVLDGGDAIEMPKRPNYVTVAGDVLSPGALQFVPGKKIKSYLAESGGYQRSADKKRVYVVYPNGIAEPVKKSRWSSTDILLPPGSTIVVPKNLKPYTSLDIITQIVSIFGQLTLSAASVAVITR